MQKIKQTKPMEARLFVLIPKESHNAIIICRRSSKKVGVFHWDMLTNKITVSQWLKGRIYEYFSDVSPDGKHFIYSAYKNGDGYTVISKAPWLKAISFWENLGGSGGGVFLTDKNYMLYDGSDSWQQFTDKSLKHIHRNNFAKVAKPYTNRSQAFGGDILYSTRLIERGWKKISKENNIMIFQKNTQNDTLLEKIVYGYPHGYNSKGKGLFWEAHRLIVNDTVEEKEDWEWCEYRYDNIYYAEKGCLYEISDINTEAKLIYDFKDEEFVEKIAPY